MFREYRIVPVVVLNSTADAVPVLGAIKRGGLPVAEICFRTDCAEESIRIAISHFPDMTIGAGTVINEEQCLRAISAGAKFIVSPGLSEEVANICTDRGIPYYPGVVTPTEVMKALSLGITTLKFFPAVDFGGLKTIKTLCAAFPQIQLMPTGGINEDNLTEYLAYPKVIACGGSWMTKGDENEIEESTRRAVALVKGV